MMLDIDRVKLLIRERCGLRFEGGDTAKLAQALAERIEDTGVAKAGYFGLLAGNADEFKQLVNLLTINETYFFREPEQISLLVDRLLPRLLAARGEQLPLRPLRILSAGCSSGEEPYSLAMALCEKYGDGMDRRFEILGGDIDSAVLARARRGRYSEFSFRATPSALRERYFERDGSHYTIREDIRRRVAFYELNLLAPEHQQTFLDFDVVLFRNVSIYFDEQTRRAIQTNLAAAMNADGILITGAAETLANDLGIMSLVEEEGRFYFVKGAAAPPPKASLPPQRTIHPHDDIASVARAKMVSVPMPSPVPPAPAFPQPRLEATPTIDALVALVEEHRYEEVLPQLERRLASAGGDAAALLLKAYVQLERKDFAGAESAIKAVLDSDPWSVDALVLLGLTAKWRGQSEVAIGHFRQAIYACNECWPAHYHLADLYRAAEAMELARREYRIVLQLLAGEAPRTGLHTIPVGLPAGQVRFLCEHQLGRIEGEKARIAPR